MRNTFTNSSPSLPDFKAQSNGQSYQDSFRGLNPSAPAPGKSKLKRLMVMLFALMMLLTIAVKAQTHTMVAGSYALTGTALTYYDPGGVGGAACPTPAGGNYPDNQDITETITANSGQQIVVFFTGGQFGIASGDFLYVYDGPSTASPLLATYTNASNAIPQTLGATSSNSVTFRFTSNGSTNCKGWSAVVSPYYYLQPGNFSFSCPGTYTFVDPQQQNSGTPGGDATCVTAGSTKNYVDAVFSSTETFSTSNGQCIQVDGSFPSNFGICSGDTLTIYDGPTTLSPIANSGTALYTNTFATFAAFQSLTSSVTYKFFSDGGTHARGWQLLMTCVNCPATSPNNDCVNAIPLVPAAGCNAYASSVSQTNSNANPFLAPTCTGTNTANDDVWYSFVANNSNMSVKIVPTDGTMDPVIQLLSGTCGSFTSLFCANSFGAGGTETLNATGLTIGNTYYVRVYDAAVNNAAHTFNICVVGSAPTDCVGAIQVCSSSQINGTFTWNSYGTQEWSSGAWGCILYGESTSQWLYWTCETSGTMEFNMASSNGTFQDIDWALWELGGGMTCPMNAQPIRCTYATGFATNSYGLPAYSTGLQAAESDVTECAGTCGGTANAFVDAVNIVAGRTYVLMLNLWTGNINYQMTFNLTNGATFDDCVLPIELLTFDGETLGAVNRIFWNTQSEVNNDHFVLEHSADAKSFSDLASINASGNSGSPSSYDYYDQHPFNGINYYRLRQVDADGSFSYSQIISLERYADLDAVPSIYPNPTTGIFNVGLVSSEDCKVEIEVFNNVGQQIQRMQMELHPGENNFPVDLVAFDRGVYTVKIRACDIGKVFTTKIVKI